MGQLGSTARNRIALGFFGPSPQADFEFLFKLGPFIFLFFGGWELFLEAGKIAFIIRPEACACVLQSVSNLHTTVPI